MSTVISGNMVGGAAAPLKTVILEDENGNQFTGVCVESVQIFDATDNDVREGKTYVSDLGASVGTKDIPSYRTYQGMEAIFPGDAFSITTLAAYDQYDYTKLQCIICKFNTTLADSVFADKTVLNNQVFEVNSLHAISDVQKNLALKTIDFNVINNTEDIYVIHFFTYREEI